jgi:hypothetical protein
MNCEGNTVTLTLTDDEYAGVVKAIWIAQGLAVHDYGHGSPEFRRWRRICDAVNEGNPNYTPYNVEPETTA